jgi:ribosome-associated protein
VTRTKPLKAPAKKTAARKSAAKPAARKASPKRAARKPAPEPAVKQPLPDIPAELLAASPKAAKPRKPRGKKPAAEKPKGALDIILARLEDAKAEQVVTITLDDKTAVADAMVVASGRSNRHVGAIADQLVQKLKEKGYRDLRIEGMPQCDWVLVDAGDVVVHIFRPEVRSFYNLEKLWSAHAPDDRMAM